MPTHGVTLILNQAKALISAALPRVDVRRGRPPAMGDKQEERVVIVFVGDSPVAEGSTSFDDRELTLTVSVAVREGDPEQAEDVPMAILATIQQAIGTGMDGTSPIQQTLDFVIDVRPIDMEGDPDDNQQGQSVAEFTQAYAVQWRSQYNDPTH